MKSNNKLISIITVVYNGVNEIENTICSVLNQTYTNIEYIVIDGGSNDGTAEIIEKYVSKISVSISEPDDGIYDAMNKGIDHASGRWILFMNCGDTFCSKDTIAEIKPYLTSDVNIVYGDTMLNYNKHPLLIKSSSSFESIVYDIPFCHQSVFVKLSLLRANKFELRYKYAADYNFFLNIFKKKEDKAKRITIPISIYDMHGASNGLGALTEYYLISKKLYPYSWATFKHYLRVKRYLCKMKVKKLLPKTIIKIILDRKNKNTVK